MINNTIPKDPTSTNQLTEHGIPWDANRQSSMLADISASLEPTKNENLNVLITITGGVNESKIICRGTYAHPKLVTHIASWVSDEFA